MKSPPSSSAAAGSLTVADRRLLAAVSTGVATLSLAGSGFIVICYLLFKELHKFSFKLVFFLAISKSELSLDVIFIDSNSRHKNHGQSHNMAGIFWGFVLALSVTIGSVIGHAPLEGDMPLCSNPQSVLGAHKFLAIGLISVYILIEFSLLWISTSSLKRWNSVVIWLENKHKTINFFGCLLEFEDMFCSLFTIVGDPTNGFFCYAQDYSAHFFCVASFLWTTTIAFTLHRTVVKHKTDVEDFGSIFHLYVWGTSLVMTIIRSIGSDYGRPGSWCWTELASTGKVAHLITFYVPLWGAILYNGFTYFQVNRMLNNATRMAVGMGDRSNQFDTRADRKAFNRWGYYPLILIGSWAFGTINRVYDFVNPGHKIFWLSFLDVGFAGLMGLFNSIAYGLNSSVRKAIAERSEIWIPERFKRKFPTWFRPRGQQENELVSLIVEGQK